MATEVTDLSAGDLEMRREICAVEVTLNGRPAQIYGARRDFAVVRDRETGLGAEWSWDAVRRIVANGGEFKT